MQETIIRFDNVKKEYRLGQFGSGTLYHDLQSWMAKIRGKEDPNAQIGADASEKGTHFLALNGISFEVKKGEALGIIGHNGAGKSTLLKLLCRVTTPTEGTISYNGRIASMLEVGTGFNGEMTGRENIYMNGAILGMTKAEINKKMDNIIEFSEVRQFIDTPVKRYSSGMYVKLAFSVAAHLDSEIMIMDEVLAVGDMAFQKKCLDKMRSVATQEGRTVLYVSHNMNTIRQLCDRCIVLNKGKIIFDGDVEEAIKIYLGDASDETMAIAHDLSRIPRLYQFGKLIKLTSFRFLNQNQPLYEVGDEVFFEVSLDANIPIDNAQLVLMIKDENSMKIGISITQKVNIKAEKNQTFQFKARWPGLMVDKYLMDIGIMKKNDDGSYYMYDDPGVNIGFQICNEYANGIHWKKEYWGNVMLPMTEVIHK